MNKNIARGGKVGREVGSIIVTKSLINCMEPRADSSRELKS